MDGSAGSVHFTVMFHTTEHKMNFDRIKKAFDSKDKSQISEVSSRICALDDMTVLKELAAHYDEFRKMVAELPKESSYGQDYRFSSLRAANLLGNIANGRCLCYSYNSGNSFFPPTAEKRGVIKILDKKANRETHSTTYHYECVKCGSKRTVSVNMGGHGPFTH